MKSKKQKEKAETYKDISFKWRDFRLQDIKEETLKEYFHPKDDLLSGITFEELIDTIYSNEKVVNENVVKKVFRNLVNAKIHDAEYELKQSMKQIIKAASGE
jgi:hypothetical protein